MTYTELIERGILLIENEYPDYVGVTLGPDDEGTCVALGYAHTEDVITSIDFDTDETTETVRWFAYDATEHVAPGTAVGRTNGGYGTREEAVMALVAEYEDELVAHGFHVDEGRAAAHEAIARTPWGTPEVESCPYLDDDDEFPVVMRIPTKEHRDTLAEEVTKAIDTLMGEWHPEASRRAKVAGKQLASRILQFFPVLWDAGINPTIDIRAEVSVDSYGNTWLDDGDPFKSLGLRIYYAVHDDRYDMKDWRSVRTHGSLELDVYEPADDDPEQLVHVVAGSGRDCVATNEMGMFIEAGSSGAESDEEITRTVDEVFFKFLALVTSSLLRGVTDGDEPA